MSAITQRVTTVADAIRAGTLHCPDKGTTLMVHEDGSATYTDHYGSVHLPHDIVAADLRITQWVRTVRSAA